MSGPHGHRYTETMTSPLLMIEDDARLAQMVIEYLGQSGFEVTHANDGEQGLEQLQQGWKPSAIDASWISPNG